MGECTWKRSVRLLGGAHVQAGIDTCVHPVLLHVGGVALPSYGVFVAMGMFVGWWVRRREVARLGYVASPGHRWVGLGALLGAAVGSKLGMVLFGADLGELWHHMLDADFTGKTVVGGVAGGYLGVELTKRIVGVSHSTGDGFAVALPLAQGFGRIGCLLHGCCAGIVTEGPVAVLVGGVRRLPAPAFESGLDFALAGVLWAIRLRPRPEGVLFKLWLIGYAAIRFVLEPLRADAVIGWGGLTWVQWVCLATMGAFGGWVMGARAGRR